jgi:CheY-like chemotaxis protein
MNEPLRVLVVDDCPETRASLRTLLRLWGHDTREAADGPAALAAAEEFRPQAVLLDINMPGMDGYEVARRLRPLECRDGCLVLAMSGPSQVRDVEGAWEAGFDGRLLKPLDVRELERLLGNPAHRSPPNR